MTAQQPLDRRGAVRGGPGDVPALHCLPRELEGGVAEVEVRRFEGVSFARQECATGVRAGLIQRGARHDRAGAVRQGDDRRRRETEDVYDDSDVSLLVHRGERDAKKHGRGRGTGVKEETGVERGVRGEGGRPPPPKLRGFDADCGRLVTRRIVPDPTLPAWTSRSSMNWPAGRTAYRRRRPAIHSGNCTRIVSRGISWTAAPRTSPTLRHPSIHRAPINCSARWAQFARTSARGIPGGRRVIGRDSTRTRSARFANPRCGT